jgi:hypothetical protein
MHLQQVLGCVDLLYAVACLAQLNSSALAALAAAATVSVCRFARAAISQGQLRVILPNGEERHYGGSEDTVPAPVPAGVFGHV